MSEVLAGLGAGSCGVFFLSTPTTRDRNACSLRLGENRQGMNVNLIVVLYRCGVALDVWMLPLGEEIFKYDIDQPLFFINTQAFHRWKENMEPLKNFINKKPGKRSYLETSYYCAFHKHANSEVQKPSDDCVLCRHQSS